MTFIKTALSLLNPKPLNFSFSVLTVNTYLFLLLSTLTFKPN